MLKKCTKNVLRLQKVWRFKCLLKKFLKELIIDKSKIPIIDEKGVLKDALESMSNHKYGVCFCVNKK